MPTKFAFLLLVVTTTVSQAASSNGFFLAGSVSQSALRQQGSDASGALGFGGEIAYRAGRYADFVVLGQLAPGSFDSVKRMTLGTSIEFRPVTEVVEVHMGLGAAYHQFSLGAISERTIGMMCGTGLDVNLFEGLRAGAFGRLHFIEEKNIATSFQEFGIRLSYLFSN